LPCPFFNSGIKVCLVSGTKLQKRKLLVSLYRYFFAAKKMKAVMIAQTVII